MSENTRDDLMEKIDSLRLEQAKSHDFSHKIIETLAKQSKDIEYLCKNSNKLEVGLWGKEGTGGLLERIQKVEKTIYWHKGYLAAGAISFTALLSWLIKRCLC